MEDVQTLWADYKANPADNSLRDRLAECYFSWARDLAWKIAYKMQLRDPDNAVGEVLKSFALAVIPNYDGQSDKGSFKAWAAVCIKRLLIDCSRKERSRTGVFHMFSLSEKQEDSRDTLADSLPSSPTPLYSDFLDNILASGELSECQAAIMFLRFCRGLTRTAAATLLGLSRATVEAQSQAAFAKIRRLREADRV